jgi:uncharacterized phage protein gp47/JayE
MAYTPPSLGSAGLSVPAYADILADLLAQFQSCYPQNAYLGIDAADYQWISAVAAKCADTMSCCQLAYNARSALTAIGAGLDGIGKVNGIARKAASASTAAVTLTCSAGVVTTINNGVVRDANGYLWSLPALITVGISGSLSVTATCQTLGAITAAANQIIFIASVPTAGWTSVTNLAAAVAGLPVETDSQFRARQSLSVALPSLTMLQGTTAAIAALSGVSRYNVLENPTGAVDSNGTPAHSITAVVEGGADAAIAQAIYGKRGIGCHTNGTTTVTVTDAFTLATMPIRFSRPTYVPVYVSLNVHDVTLTGALTTAVQAAIKAALVTYLNSLQIGELVVLSELYGAALTARSNPDLPIFSIRALTLGTSASPTGTADIAMAYNQVAQGLAGNVVLAVV